jgi:WD40 repeat protein
VRSLAIAALLLQALGGGAGSPDIVLQSGHTANISALAFSPDGTFLVSASEDATLKLWDPNTGAEIRTLRGHSNIVTAMAINAASTLIASASLDHTLRVWNAGTGEQVAAFRGPVPAVYLLKITPDSNSLVTAETVAAGTVLRVWDIKSARQTRVIKRDDAAVSHVFFSGSTMSVGDEAGEDDATGSLTTYNLKNGKIIQARPALLCGASDDGNWLAIDQSTEAQRRALIVDVAHNKPMENLSGQVSRVMFSSAGDWLAYESMSGDSAVVRRTAGGAARTIRGRGAEFSMLTLSPDGRLLATTGADFSIHIWDVETGKLAHAASGQYTPSVIAFSPDSHRVAVNGGGPDLGNALQIWDIERKAQVPAPRLRRPVVGLSFSKDGAYLAVSSPSLEVFDTRTNASVAKFDCGPAPALFPVFSPNGKWLAANCGGVVSVWSLSTGAESFHFGEASAANNGPLLFSPDGRLLAVGSSNGLVVYSVITGKTVQTIPTSDAVSALVFNTSGEWVAFGVRSSAPKPSLFLWELRTNRKVWSATTGQTVTALQFAHDGRALLVAAGSLTLFDASSGRLLRQLPPKVPNGSVPAFSPNAEWFGVGWNSATNLWRLPMN